MTVSPRGNLYDIIGVSFLELKEIKHCLIKEVNIDNRMWEEIKFIVDIIKEIENGENNKEKVLTKSGMEYVKTRRE